MELLIVSNAARTHAVAFRAAEYDSVPPGSAAHVIAPGETHLGLPYEEWLARLGMRVALSPAPQAARQEPASSPDVRIGAVLDGGFQLIRRGSLPLLLLAALFQLPPILLSMLPYGPRPSTPWLWMVPLWAWSSMAQAVFVLAFSQAYHGSTPDLRLAMRQAVLRGGAVIAAGVMVTALVTAGMFLFVLPGLFLLCRYFAVIPVVVLEDQGPWKALGRSGSLGEGAGLIIFATFGILEALSFLVRLGLRNLPGDGLPILAAVGVTVAANTFLALLSAAVVTSFYYALRVAREGYDLELLTEQLAEGEPEPVPA